MATIHISNQQKDNVMSVLNQLYQKGEARGEVCGEARGKAEALLLTAKIIKMHTRGFDAAAIAAVLATV